MSDTKLVKTETPQWTPIFHLGYLHSIDLLEKEGIEYKVYSRFDTEIPDEIRKTRYFMGKPYTDDEQKYIYAKVTPESLLKATEEVVAKRRNK